MSINVGQQTWPVRVNDPIPKPFLCSISWITFPAAI